jgi:hypothetical protein
LADIATTIGEASGKEVVQSLIVRKFGDKEAPAAAGALLNGKSVAKRVALARKYPGGEGPEHLALKKWVAKNPSCVGLPAASVPHVEHLFQSGDCVDIAFRLPGGNWAVVEIETTQPFPGAHQAIKYRALLAAQQDWKLNTNRVAGLLVAWAYSPTDLEFCRRYGIQAWQCRKGKTGSLES